jgi:hypothetical protein
MPAPEPVFSRTVAPIAPSYAVTPPWAPPAVAAAAPAPVAQPQLGPVKLKNPIKPPRGQRAPEPAVDIYAPAPSVVSDTGGSPFPWKLVAAAAVIMVVAIVGGRVYLPAKGITPEEAATAAPASQPAKEAMVSTTGAGANTGRLEIETEPAGARILIDGKPAGESPVALDGIPAGRHVVTLISSSGSVRRTIRVDAGRIAKLDIPIFSGWVGIYAPFVLEVSEAGRVIGTTEEPRLLLSPGRHDLTLTNRELGYRSLQSVEIEPGELRSVSLDPRGTVNLNAAPWAEVIIDGRKAGDTPIANLQLPLGTRNLVFRHPQFGERRVTVTVKANADAAVSVDMTKPAP